MMNDLSELQSRLQLALNAKGAEYIPRTRHLQDGRPLYTNRLILEDSPYLLQHAHNPVNWFPWGEQAFAAARRENKPLFLSIGYATCHWCHVMEEQSFESIAVAKILNAHFIAVKVDREQYPDVDHTYMTAVTLLTGQGGWPMSSFLTCAGKPFFAGTYFPEAGFIDLLLKISQAWNTQNQALIKQAEQLAEAVAQTNSTREKITKLELTTIQTALEGILYNFDALHGGFSLAPKFPNEPLLLLLLQAAKSRHNAHILPPLEQTLNAMLQGGIYDQVGGGFHRYSTDTQWLVPHFEKMLYNQAYLARVYSQAYRLTGNPLYARCVRQTLDYVLREMRAQNGEFFSATDADSEGHEGTFFVWSKTEIEPLLGSEDAALIIKIFGVTEQGNFEGKNIFYLPESLQRIAEQEGVALQILLARINPLLAKLREFRSHRIPPLTDNKIIVAWNGMLITALAEAGDILAEKHYIDVAEQAASTLWKNQYPEPGELWRVNLDGKASIPGRQDDYVHFAESLLALYDVRAEPRYLQQARQLCDEMLDKFLDTDSGALRMGRDPLLFAQPKDSYDGALPSGNAVAVRVLNRLSKRTGNMAYENHAAKILDYYSAAIIRQPTAYAYMLAQLSEMRSGETGSRQFAAQGEVKISATLKTDNGRLILEIALTIAEGRHINAHQPLQENLTATEIFMENDSYWKLIRVDYPPPDLLAMDFAPKPVALYQGQTLITAELKQLTDDISTPIQINLRLQSCSHESCRPEERISLLVYPATVLMPQE